MNENIGYWVQSDAITLTKDKTIQDALSMLENLGSSELPVVENKRFLGVVKLNDCIDWLKNNVNWNESISTLITATSRTVHENFSLKELYDWPLYIIDKTAGTFTGVFGKKELQAYHRALQQTLEYKNQQLEWYQLCFDTAYEGLAVVDESGVIQMFNETYSRFVEVTKEEAIGLPVEKVIENTRLPVVLKTGIPEQNQIHQLQGQRMIVHRLPIWKNGEVIGAVGMLTYEGLSEIYRMMEKIEQLNITYKQEKKLAAKQIGFVQTVGLEEIIGESQAISRTKKIARRAAQSRAAVLITGESGVGKELFARAIHEMGEGKNGHFIALNCAAIPENLLESELFGYAEGAFTGSKKEGKPGKFELAHNGTLFLDEIGDMPLSTQVKILRVLQEKEVERVGGTKPIPVHFRLIAATNQPLKQLVQEGKFREDLYYRLHVIPLHIPPLRQRKEDIPVIIAHLIPKICKKYQIREKTIDKEVMRLFFRYDWPGNVRELINLLERLFALVDRTHLLKSDLPEEFLIKKEMPRYPVYQRLHDRNEALRLIQDEEERGLIENVLKEVKGNKSKAAKKLGISRATLYNKLSRFNVPYH